MANVYDVAAYILQRTGPITAMKLQKLVYYAQAWSLVWDETPLFQNRIEAWANGPVCPDLYGAHQGHFMVNASLIEPRREGDLSESQRNTIESVINYYNRWNASQLSDLTHQEDPWRNARIGVPEGQRSNNEITIGNMADYYGNL